MKMHLAGPPVGDNVVPWCGTPRSYADLNITAKWDDVTCARCGHEVTRRRKHAHRMTLAERAAAQGTIDIDADAGTLTSRAGHPSLRNNVVNLDDYRRSKTGTSGP